MTDTSTSLQRAIRALEIRSVDLAGVQLILSPDYLDGAEPDSAPGALFNLGRHQVNRAQQIGATLDTPPFSEVQLLRYRFEAELVVKDKQEDGEVVSNADPIVAPWVRMNAEFRVEYLAKEVLDAEAIIAFGRRNVAYHVWPYWRELVQSSLARTRFPVPISVPHYLAKSGFDVERMQTVDSGSLDQDPPKE